MNNDIISVVVPVYKVEEYLSTCIESIIRQTYKSLEIILVDDGSPDNCGKICDEYAIKDKRIRVFHKQNGGLSDARNFGISVATGKYIAFIDSDDFISDDFFEVLLREVEANDCDIAECGVFKFSNEQSLCLESSEDTNKVMTSDAWLVETRMKDFISVIACNKIYKRTLFHDIQYPVGRKFEDEATTYKLVYRAKKIARTTKKMYFYRQREGSITQSTLTEKALNDKTLAFRERISFFKEKQEDRYESFTKAKYCILLISAIKETFIKNDINKQKEIYADVFEIYKDIIKKKIPIKYKLFLTAYIICPFIFTR